MWTLLAAVGEISLNALQHWSDCRGYGNFLFLPLETAAAQFEINALCVFFIIEMCIFSAKI